MASDTYRNRRTRLALGAVACASILPAIAKAALTEPFWPEVDHARATAPASGIQVLRLPPDGRVRLGPGKFMMGSTPVESLHAMALCEREILRRQCDQLSPLLRGELSAHEVTLSAFDIDRTEVTVAAYSTCVRAGICAPPAFAPGDKRFDNPRFPVTYVRWEDADTYCRWAGGRLPTEAEWEYAARGEYSREFPWGNVYNPHLCNHGSFVPNSGDGPDHWDGSDGYVGLAPVGSFPDGATPTGLYDMAGNVAEWVADVYDLDDHGFGYSATPQVDPKPHQASGGPQFHVIRGGSYAHGANWMRGAARGYLWTQRSASVGFRCVSDAEPRHGAEETTQ